MEIRRGEVGRATSGTVVLVVLVSLTLLVAGPALPSWAHASGELPTAQLHSEGDRVTVEYLAPPDDAAVIGTRLGYLGEAAMLALLGGPADDLPTDDEVARFSRSSALRTYLEDHIVVIQDGEPCDGQARPADDFLADGAQVEFRCPEPVEHARVRITVLHDEDKAYRTFSVDGTAQYAIHTVAAPEHAWDFTVSPQGDGLDPVLVAGGAVLLLVLAGALIALPKWRRASRR